MNWMTLLPIVGIVFLILFCTLLFLLFVASARASDNEARMEVLLRRFDRRNNS